MKTKSYDRTQLVLSSELMQQVYRLCALSPLRPSRMAYNLTISHHHRFIWFRVAKTATRTLFSHFRNHNIPLDAEHPYQVRYSERYYRSYFKFSFVRNPWDRVVSAWVNKVVDHNRWNFDEATLRELQEFRNFVTYLETLDLSVCDQHLRRQSDLIDLNNLDFLGRFESFDRDFAEVCHRLGLPDYEPAVHNQSPKRNDYRSYYDDALAERVSNLYRKDIQLFNYTF
jgi:hypothetical protein